MISIINESRCKIALYSRPAGQVIVSLRKLAKIKPFRLFIKNDCCYMKYHTWQHILSALKILTQD